MAGKSPYLNLFYETDLDLPTSGSGDISLYTGNDLESAVLMSLFANARATVDEMLHQDHDDPMGWWADDKFKMGSKLWLLRRSKLTANSVRKIHMYITDALDWMIQDGVCAAIKVDVKIVDINAVRVIIQIIKDDGTVLTLNFDDLWAKLEK